MTDRDAGSGKKEAESQTTKRDETETQAGQEARRGVPPGEHDREHQSQYGGGGTNGGANK